jgi:hypothetical protein
MVLEMNEQWKDWWLKGRKKDIAHWKIPLAQLLCSDNKWSEFISN